MKDTVSRAFERARSTFLGFSAGQKAITVIGTVANIKHNNIRLAF